MEQHVAQYYAELLTNVTDNNYVAEQDGLDKRYYAVYKIALNGEKQIQPRGNIRLALMNAASQCHNGLAQL